MQVLRVSHLTRYRYARPVRFGEHRMMLRPRETPDQTLISERLVITPEPVELSFIQDRLGNWIGVARFDGAASELCFRSEIEVARQPASPRPVFEGNLLDLLAPRPDPAILAADPEGAVTAWARGFLPREGARPTLETLVAVNRTIRNDFTYRRRLEHGVQPPWRTLALRSGACRDHAVLMIAAARALGLKARFVSGYVHCPQTSDLPRASAGHTHAWASIRTPGHGWLDFDPTSGAVGPDGMVRVAVADDPAQALPLQGTYFGAAGDFLGMDVEVDVRSQTKSAGGAACIEPQLFRRVAGSAA